MASDEKRMQYLHRSFSEVVEALLALEDVHAQRLDELSMAKKRVAELEAACREAYLWLGQALLHYSNGDTSLSEEDVLDWKGHCELLKTLEEALEIV